MVVDAAGDGSLAHHGGGVHYEPIVAGTAFGGTGAGHALGRAFLAGGVVEVEAICTGQAGGHFSGLAVGAVITSIDLISTAEAGALHVGVPEHARIAHCRGGAQLAVESEAGQTQSFEIVVLTDVVVGQAGQASP